MPWWGWVLIAAIPALFVWALLVAAHKEPPEPWDEEDWQPRRRDDVHRR